MFPPSSPAPAAPAGPPAEQASGHTAGVAVIVVCILVVLAGLVAVVRWGGLTVEPPHAPAAEVSDPATRRANRRRWGWWPGGTCGT